MRKRLRRHLCTGAFGDPTASRTAGERYSSSPCSTCPAALAKSLAPFRASCRVFPWHPTSTKREPLVNSWL